MHRFFVLHGIYIPVVPMHVLHKGMYSCMWETTEPGQNHHSSVEDVMMLND